MKILSVNNYQGSNNKQKTSFGAFYVPGALQEKFFYKSQVILRSVAEEFPNFAATYKGTKNLRNIVLTVKETELAKMNEAAMQDSSIGISSSVRDAFIKSCIEKPKMAKLEDLEEEFQPVEV